MGRVKIEDKMLVRCVSVEADGGRLQAAAGAGQESIEQLTHLFDLPVIDFTADPVGVGGFTLMMERDLDSIAQIGKAVEELSGSVFPKVDWTIPGLEILGPRARLKPEED